jgi:hypothetical protein
VSEQNHSRPEGQALNQTHDLRDLLYKYRCWDDRKESVYHKRLLTDNEIHFARPSSLDDPFDSQITLRLDRESSLGKWLAIMKWYRQSYPSISREKRERWAWRRMLDLNDPGKLKKERDRQRRILDEAWGVFSLTAKCDSRVMWATYANSHRGICVGFSSRALVDFSDRLFDKDGIPGHLWRVEYVDDYPVIDALSLNYVQGDWGLRAVRTKSRDWEYQEEHRLVIGGRSDLRRTHSLPDEAIAVVILGCRMHASYKEEIKSILRTKTTRIELLQAELKENSFELHFESVAY